VSRTGGVALISSGDLSALQLLALLAVNFAPLQRCSDGLWRCDWRHFPQDGVDFLDLQFLRAEGLLEMTETVAVVTVLGRDVLLRAKARLAFPMSPPMSGYAAAHSTMQ